MCKNCDNKPETFEEFLAALQKQLTEEDDRMDSAQREIDSFKDKTIRSIPIADKVTLHILDETHSGRIHTIVKVLTELQNNYPATGKVDVYYPSDTSNLDNSYGQEGSKAQASTTTMNKGRIDDGPDRVLQISNLAFSDQRSYDGWHMPAHNLLQEGPAVIVHEWGHVIDNRSVDFVQKTLTNAGMMNAYGDVNPEFIYSLSDYGKMNEKESYAECFTEWVGTNGETDNFAAKWYAKEFKWPKRTMSLPKSRAHKKNDNKPYDVNPYDLYKPYDSGEFDDYDSYYG